MKKIITIFLTMLMCFTAADVKTITVKAEPTDYVHEIEGGIVHENLSRNNYDTYSQQITSYLYYENRCPRLVKYHGYEQLTVEFYDKQYNLQKSVEVDFPRPDFGAVYIGNTYNFAFFAADNLLEDNSVEVYRVVKYDKQWNELDHLSITNKNTYLGIYGGQACHISEVENYLSIRTGHRMYADSENNHHQANIMFLVDENNMSLLDWCDGASRGDGYVSHSFNQLETNDGTYFYSADHGDAYPRGVYLAYHPSTQFLRGGNVYPVPADPDYFGRNETGFSIGGLEVSDNNILTAMNAVPYSENWDEYDLFADRSILLLVTPKDSIGISYTQRKYFNHHDDDGIYACTPVLTKINNNLFLLMWEEIGPDNIETKMVLVDGEGEKVSKEITTGFMLSDCQPVVEDGKVCWFASNNITTYLYSVDCSSVAEFESLDGTDSTDGIKQFLKDYEYDMRVARHTITLNKYIGSNQNVDMSFLNKYYNIRFNLTDTVFKGNDYIRSIYLPARIEGYPEGFLKDCTALETATLGNLEEIPGWFFMGCTALKKVNIPDSVTKIGTYAFYSCSSLEKLNLGKGVKLIEDAVFPFCTSLEEITFASDGIVINPTGMFQDCPSLKSIDLSHFDFGETTYLRGMFCNCYSLEEVVFPKDQIINATTTWQLFENCYSLRKIDISSINNANSNSDFDMFKNCISLNEMILGSGFTKWNDDSNLPVGTWIHGDLTLSEAELIEQYPANAAEWCGKWIKLHDYAVLQDDGSLVFFNSFDNYANDSVGKAYDRYGNAYEGIIYGNFDQEVRWKDRMSSIRKVYVAEGSRVYPIETYEWFSGASNLTYFNGTGMDSSRNLYMQRMFYGCTSLVEVDMSEFKTGTVRHTTEMFSGCKSLKTIYATDEFDIDDVDSTTEMFKNCVSLVGGNGTLYDPNHINRDYARIDREGTPGYFTLKKYDRSWSWSSDLSSATLTLKDIKTGNETTHKAEISVEKTDPTCTSEGQIRYIATVIYEDFKYVDVKSSPVAAIGHKYEKGQWNWASDYSSAELIFVCANDGSHTSVQKASISENTEGEITTYTATVVFEGKTYTDVKKSGSAIVGDPYTRIYGSNRYETSLLSADYLKKLQGVEKFDCVVLAYGQNFPDALSGSYLANLHNAPIILIKAEYAQRVRDYIKNNVNKKGTVYVLGGPAVIPDSWLGSLSNSYNVKRLAGSNRYGSNIEVLKEVGYSGGRILVCVGTNFADSLSASAVKLPILLVGTGLNDDQKAFLKKCDNAKFIIIGGEGAVSSAVEKELGKYGKVTDRLAGTNRFHTSMLIAYHLFDQPSSAVLAYGRNFPDGLSGGSLAYALQGPLLLVENNKSNCNDAAWITYIYETDRSIILGGTGLISDDIARYVLNLSSKQKIKVITNN